MAISRLITATSIHHHIMLYDGDQTPDMPDMPPDPPEIPEGSDELLLDTWTPTHWTNLTVDPAGVVYNNVGLSPGDIYFHHFVDTLGDWVVRVADLFEPGDRWALYADYGLGESLLANSSTVASKCSATTSSDPDVTFADSTWSRVNDITLINGATYVFRLVLLDMAQDINLGCADFTLGEGRIGVFEI